MLEVQRFATLILLRHLRKNELVLSRVKLWYNNIHIYIWDYMGYIMVIKLVTHWDAPLSRCRPELGLKPYTFADWLLKVTCFFLGS